MDIEAAYRQIERDRPPVVYLSGKTCTGKSTFAARLKDNLGYDPIELDNIVLEHVIKPLKLSTSQGLVFVEVYRHETQSDWVDSFVAATRAVIAEKLARNQPIVIDGAIANLNTLTRIFTGYDFTFIYLHPQRLANYVRNLTSRFMVSGPRFQAGLPRRFWDFIDAAELAKFHITRQLTSGLKESIMKYAQSSQIESQKRLANFQTVFANIIKVEI